MANKPKLRFEAVDIWELVEQRGTYKISDRQQKLASTHFLSQTHSSSQVSCRTDWSSISRTNYANKWKCESNAFLNFNFIDLTIILSNQINGSLKNHQKLIFIELLCLLSFYDSTALLWHCRRMLLRYFELLKRCNGTKITTYIYPTSCLQLCKSKQSMENIIKPIHNHEVQINSALS